MRTYVLAALTVALAIVAAGSDTVAIVDGVTITRSGVACGPFLRNAPADCHRAAQARLERRVIASWIDAASRLNHLTLTSAEQAVVEAKVTADRPITIRSVEHFQTLTAAILRIRQGEDASKVYHDAEEHGIKEWELDQQAWLLPTLEAARTAASKDDVAEAERAIRADERRRLLALRIRELLRKRVVESGGTLRDAEKAFWSDIAASIHTQILDTTFRLPDATTILR
jgi:hypothetical protein